MTNINLSHCLMFLTLLAFCLNSNELMFWTSRKHYLLQFLYLGHDFDLFCTIALFYLLVIYIYICLYHILINELCYLFHLFIILVLYCKFVDMYPLGNVYFCLFGLDNFDEWT